MEPTTILIWAFIALSLALKVVWEKIDLFLRSNFKYRVINYLATYIYYGNDSGVHATLQLDSPSTEILKRRIEGQRYLDSKLSCSGGGGADTAKSKSEFCGPKLASSLVDCRFALAKVCMPLLRELEFPNAGRNFVSAVSNNESDGTGMLMVTTEDGVTRELVGNDAVHTLGVKSFYAPIQKEINRRMELAGKDNDSMLRFSPISMNAELERNVSLLKNLTGMDKIRYSLSGSEAVDAALKDIKASCNHKPLIVRFKSAYHGHISGINFIDCAGHVFLPECSQQSLDFIERYHYRIAAVIVNPMQHFTGINKPSPPGEKVTHTSRIRSAVSRDEYSRWLHSLQEKCNYCTKYLTQVAMVVDDIYFAFRTPELLSAKYFTHPETKVPLKPDVIILGKALAAGYPLSAVAGKEGFLNSYDKKFLLQVNKTVGTMAAWHGGIVASNVFLEAIEGTGCVKVSARDQLRRLINDCNNFTASLNAKFEAAGVPVRIRNFSNTFSIDYLNKSLYNSRYPQYLLAEGLFLGNYSTGKFNLNADVCADDFRVLESKFVAAATRMKCDGYFEPMNSLAKYKLYLNLAARFTRNYSKLFYEQIMSDKHIDIEVSHNHPVNKFGHFWSSVGMLVFAYPLIFWKREPLKGCCWFLITHIIRQTGHFFYEHQDRDIEKLKFGHKDASKKEAVAFLLAAAIFYKYQNEFWDFTASYVDRNLFELSIDQYVSTIAMFTVIPHFVEIVYQYGALRGLSWTLKILTDPCTDLLDFYTHIVIHPKFFLDFKDQRASYRLDMKTKKVTKIE